jgi:hypothetical protein
MAHYAFLDENNIVTEVIAGKHETELIDGITPEEWYGNFRGQKCVRTSYNNNIRKRYAGIGFTYDPISDVFIEPQPFPSWTLNSNHDWQPPISQPDGSFGWNEETLTWVPFPAVG